MGKRKEALALAESMGLHVSTYSPGGVPTLYRVTEMPRQYFEGGELFTASGPAELLAWLQGYRVGSGMDRWPSQRLATLNTES